MATIHRRKLRTGEVVWVLTHGTGRDRQRFVAGRTRDEAQVILTQFKRQLALHGESPQSIALRAAVEQYHEFLKTNRRHRTTIRYMRVLRTFVNCFMDRMHSEHMRLRDVRPAHIEEFKRLRSEGRITDQPTDRERQREQALRLDLNAGHVRTKASDNAKFGWLGRHGLRVNVTPRTVNYELRVLFTFFHWATKRNYLFLNPSAPVERFRLPKRVIPKFMTSDELRKFFAVCSASQRRLFMTVLLTGMRKGEAEYLVWDDISFELAVIFIREKKDLQWQPKTDERLIPISPIVHDILLEQLDHRTSARFVFANEAGNRETHMLEKLKAVCKRAGIRAATVHALRHSFGAHLRMAGVSLADIADLLGHKDLATTQIYAKVQQEHLRQVIAKLSPLVDSRERPIQRKLTGGQHHGTLGTSHSEREPAGISGASEEADSSETTRGEGTGGAGKAG